MAALPVVAIPLDYEEELVRIKDFLQNGKAARLVDTLEQAAGEDAEETGGVEDGEEEDDDALDLYLGDGLDLDGDEQRQRKRRTGYKYRDAMVRAQSHGPLDPQHHLHQH